MSRSGFSLIEVMVGMLIFAVGVLALSASTGYMGLQIRAADMRTERSVAFQQVSEQLQAAPFDDVVDLTQANAQVIGSYLAWWDVDSLSWALKEVAVVTEGPGFIDGQRADEVVDTLIIRLARPVR